MAHYLIRYYFYNDYRELVSSYEYEEGKAFTPIPIVEKNFYDDTLGGVLKKQFVLGFLYSGMYSIIGRTGIMVTPIIVTAR